MYVVNDVPSVQASVCRLVVCTGELIVCRCVVGCVSCKGSTGTEC